MFVITATAGEATPPLTPGSYSVDELLREVSSSTGCRLAINTQFDRARTVRVTASPANVNELLDLVVANSGYKYELLDRYVIIKPDPDYKVEAPIVQAAPTGPIDPFGPKIFYFLINKSSLIRTFSTNGPMFDSLDALLRDEEIYPEIDSVVVTAASSPIGSAQHNARLAIDRANALASYIRWKHPQVDRTKISTYPLGIDWEGFWAWIENSPDVPSRDQLMRLKGMDEHVVLEMLRRTGDADTYRYLLGTVYPKLQYSSVRVVLKDGRSIPEMGSPLRKIIVPQEVVYDTVYVERVVHDTIHVAEPVQPIIMQPAVEERKPFYIALKTNLLYDGVLLPNIAVEVPFGRNHAWSAEAEMNWSWWNTSDPRWWYHRIQMGGFEFRRWLGNRADRDPLGGFYVGAYVYGGTYDVRLFTDDNPDLGQLSDFSWSAGLSVGYSARLSRRLNLELGLGLGYFTGEYKKYYRCSCADEFPWVSTHKRQWFGPTKAKASLVWLIGSGVNKTKDKNRK